MDRRVERRFRRLENWLILGDGLVYKMITIDPRCPPSAEEVMRIIKTENAVINIFDALTDEFLGMAYASINRNKLEEVR